MWVGKLTGSTWLLIGWLCHKTSAQSISIQRPNRNTLRPDLLQECAYWSDLKLAFDILSHQVKTCLRGMRIQRRPRSDCTHAVWSGPLLSSNTIIGYYRMCRWRTRTQIRLCMCRMIWICILCMFEDLFSLDVAQASLSNTMGTQQAHNVEKNINSRWINVLTCAHWEYGS